MVENLEETVSGHRRAGTHRDCDNTGKTSVSSSQTKSQHRDPTSNYGAFGVSKQLGEGKSVFSNNIISGRLIT